MRVLSIILATITLFFGFTPSAWAGSELVTPLLVIGPNSSAFQCIVTNATATSVNVDLTLIDLFGKTVLDTGSVPIGPRATFMQAFPGPRPLSCVVDVLNGQDASLVRAVLVTTDANDNITGLVDAR